MIKCYKCDELAIGTDLSGNFCCEIHDSNKCEKCSEMGMGFTDDGEFLCDDCMSECAIND